ncbi:hypothetical protein GG344DRAFT_53295, partial [Lentinula edodes]
ESCVDQYDIINCGAASNFCDIVLYSPVLSNSSPITSGAVLTCMNPYDISVPCDGSIEEILCYPVTV